MRAILLLLLQLLQVQVHGTQDDSYCAPDTSKLRYCPRTTSIRRRYYSRYYISSSRQVCIALDNKISQLNTHYVLEDIGKRLMIILENGRCQDIGKSMRNGELYELQLLRNFGCNDTTAMYLLQIRSLRSKHKVNIDIQSSSKGRVALVRFPDPNDPHTHLINTILSIAVVLILGSFYISYYIKKT